MRRTLGAELLLHVNHKNLLISELEIDMTVKRRENHASGKVFELHVMDLTSRKIQNSKGLLPIDHQDPVLFKVCHLI